MEYTDELKQMLGTIKGITEKELTVLAGISVCKEYKKGDFLLQQNDTARFSYYILDGAAREYFCDAAGREFNKAFCFKGDFTGSYYDLNSGKPSLVTIQALTDLKVIAILFESLRKLVEGDDVWCRFAYQVAHITLMKKLEKEYQLLSMSATERYQALQRQHPQLEQLVPAYHLASYLGITPVSFSRIRKELNT